MTRFAVLLGLFGLLGLVSGSVSADTTIRIASPGSIQTLYLTSGKVRAQTEQGFMLFDETEQAFTVVNDIGHSYIKLTRRGMEAMTRMFQRDSEGAPPEPLLQYRERSVKEVVTGHPCNRVEAFRDDRKVQEFCVASPDALGIPPEDYRALQAMQQAIRDMATSFGHRALGLTSWTREGVPLRVLHFDESGDQTLSQELERLSFERLEPEIFAVPAGYRPVLAPAR